MTLHTIFNNHNLAIANRFINDDEPTIAMFTDPKEEFFNKPLNYELDREQAAIRRTSLL